MRFSDLKVGHLFECAISNPHFGKTEGMKLANGQKHNAVNLRSSILFVMDGDTIVNDLGSAQEVLKKAS